MPVPPAQPKIYHITHVDNLCSIVKDGLMSDAAMLARGGAAASIGMAPIKRRRLNELLVNCHPVDHVGDYVPFYFCPRSVMLYIIHMGNKPDLTYKGGQGPIVHLEADMNSVVAWANQLGKRWAFSLSNAGAYYTEFCNDIAHLDLIKWPAVANRDFRSPDVKEGKQAEFLVHGSFPWHLVNRVGVLSDRVARRAHAALGSAPHRPVIEVRTDWYF
ncbi:MAG TPA: DUF4433 domain-containing protein [Bryobacteraceae bacterium]|jgi:hypothetical protein